MSSRRGGRGGRGGRELPREVQVSKKISWLLRHGAGQEGLTLGEGGYVNVADALQTRCLKSLKVTFDELRTVVAENDKQRFSLIPVPSHPILASSTETVPAAESSDSSKVDESNPRNFLIRANQGHSINIGSDGLLTPITKDNMPEIVVHGTTTFAWPLIMKTGGLRRMGRNHVHFAQGLPKGFIPAEPIPGNGHDEDDIVGRGAKGKESGEAPQEAKENTLVISGMRNSSTILIYIDLAKALDAGIRFWKSENGVILSEGDEKGFVGCQFFKRVEERRGGGRVLMRDGVLPEGFETNASAIDDELSSGKGRGKKRGGGSGRGRGKANAKDDSEDIWAGV